MSKEALKLAKAWFERNTYGDEAVDVYEALCAALAEQPAQTATYTCGVCGVSLQMEQPAQQEPCEMGNLCIGCSPRNADGSCPGEKPNGACDCYVKGFNDGMKELDQPAQRKPLTDEVTDRCIEAADTRWADAFVPIQWARHFKNAIEAAHGIKENT